MIEFVAVLVMTHMTIASVTIYLHRCQAHRALELHPVISHVMRFWLWTTTGMVTQQWVSVHRLHHHRCETELDPHSPQTRGIWQVLFGGAWLYAQACRDPDMIQRYGSGTPDDWIQRNIYTARPNLGIVLLLVALVMVFGVWGFFMWVVQVLWIPFWAAGVINGVGHFWGYRNVNTPDQSRNIVPWGIIVGGEELHNSHHSNPGSAKLSQKWWEFDIGWMYIRILQMLGLAWNVRAR